MDFKQVLNVDVKKIEVWDYCCKLEDRMKEFGLGFTSAEEKINLRLNQFIIKKVDCHSPSYRSWNLFGYPESIIYMIPFGTQFSWRSAFIEEIRTFTNPLDVITTNSFQDIVNLFQTSNRYFVDKPFECGNDVSSLFQQFGTKLDEKLLGIDSFDKVVCFRNDRDIRFRYDGNFCNYVGFKNGYFFVFHIETF